jgi:tRNA-2-methylthio-N6-dimethylallyladenosine synthase
MLLTGIPAVADIIGAMKYYIWTEGCQMNVVDSQRVATALEKLGYVHSTRAELADVIVLNTCVVRQSAEDKAYGRLNALRSLKKQNPALVINVMGCLVGVKNHDHLRQRFPFVDVFSPPSDPVPLVRYLQMRDGHAELAKTTEQHNQWLDEGLTLPTFQQGAPSAYIPIVLGCSHACTYCIIPYRRGVEVSRPVEDIMRDAQCLAGQGVKEIILLGQIVDRYGLDQAGYPDLADLITQLHAVDGIERIRFLTSHPRYMTDKLLDCVASMPKVMPHIEVPIQAGDDEVLANMRRGYTVEDYRRLVQKIRGRIAGVSIATDIIVGFPGESAAQFQRTYDLLADLRLDVAHLARYSPRTGTLSERSMQDDVPDEEKWRRFRLLEDLQEQVASEIHAGYLGKTVEVLFEEKKKKRWQGRTPTYKLVFVESEEDLRGKILPVKINWTGPWSMIGEIASS